MINGWYVNGTRSSARGGSMFQSSRTSPPPMIRLCYRRRRGTPNQQSEYVVTSAMKAWLTRVQWVRPQVHDGTFGHNATSARRPPWASPR